MRKLSHDSDQQLVRFLKQKDGPTDFIPPQVLRAIRDSWTTFKEELERSTRENDRENFVLTNLGEGVIVIAAGRVQEMNRAARELLDWNAEDAIGRTMEEVVRNASLLRLVAEVTSSGDAADSEVELLTGRERWLFASARVLPGASDEIVLTLTDITRLRKLEQMRRDFVSNVSHELKTPIATIQGAAETLIDGAILEPETAQRFLKIIEKHALRMHAIFDDMLTLSRLEHQDLVESEPTSVATVLSAAAAHSMRRAEAKKIQIQVDADVTLTAPMNAALIELALSNLVDNAIKYSEVGPVILSAKKQDSNVEISVIDRGFGIEPAHLPRVFERFYRIDKGRSRSEGGTGLGLAIVKHIAQAHGGMASVQSEPGKGSVFSIVLPYGKKE